MTRRVIRILHVEDSLSDAELVRLALDESGTDFELQHVTGGAEALRVLATEPRPDLVLLDLNMPGMSGHDTLSAIKSDPLLRAMPVLVLTTSGAPHDIASAYDAHANSYLRKPISYGDLVELMGRVEDYWLEAAVLPHG